MKHARPDYERFQDPAAHPDCHVYDFLRQLADAYEADRSGETEGTEVAAIMEGFFGTGLEVAPRLATVRAFAAREDMAGGHPIDRDEPVFLLRGKDVVAPAAVQLWADRAEQAGASEAIVRAAREQAHRMILWQAMNGSQIPDLPAEV